MQPKNRSPRILLFDIEVAPVKAWSWGPMYETNLIDIDQDWFMISYAWKWADKKKIYAKSLPDYPRYERDKFDDKPLVKDLWKLFDEADVIVAHNIDFDIKKSNTRFIQHRLKPPSPYKTFCTLKTARRVGKFNSNKLDQLGATLRKGRKLAHTGWHLWKKCMNGSMAAWRLMVKYNRRDVFLLSEIYDVFKPWAPNHPVLTAYTGDIACPTCQSKKIQRRGVSVAQKARYHRFHCQSCGHWFKGSRIK